MRFTLTPDQADALADIKVFLDDPKERMFVLGGHAGTGKTTLIPFAVELAIEKWHRKCAILTAPTNKAVKVLRGVAKDADLPVECYTIHSANGLRLADDDERKYLVSSGQGRMSGVKLVVVDEASMIGTRMFSMIEDEIVRHGVKVLFCGDPYQLPPVNDGKMQAFERVKCKAILQNIVRQAEGHPVIELGDFFRRRIAGETPPQPPGTPIENEVAVCYMGAKDWTDRLLADMKANALERPGEFRALAWTNRAVDSLSAKIRRAIYGDDAPRFIEGERIFTAAPYNGMHTDQEATIVEVGKMGPHPLYPDFDAIPLYLDFDLGRHDEPDVPEMFRGLRPKSRSIFEKIEDGDWEPEDDGFFRVDRDDVKDGVACYEMGPSPIAYAPADPAVVAAEGRRLADVAKKAESHKRGWCWKKMHMFLGAFADFRSVNAMTAHRSQGSTFDSVFVDANDIRQADRYSGAEFKFRLLYVACTRARKRVFIRT